MPLPPGERVLWEGSPSAGALLRHLLHVRLVAGYFAAMLVLWAVQAWGMESTPDFLRRLGAFAGLSLLPLAFAWLYAREIARTTTYAITDRRVVIRLGVVFTMVLNLPHKLIASAGLRRFGDGTGQVAIELAPGERVAYTALWPHCRVTKLNRPVPLLRGLADPERVGAVLRDAVLAVAQAEADAAEATPSGATDKAGAQPRAVTLPPGAGLPAAPGGVTTAPAV